MEKLNSCIFCGKEFKPRSDNKNAKYCSRRCYLSDPNTVIRNNFSNTRKKASAKLKELWKNPEFRKSQSEKISKATKEAMLRDGVREKYEASLPARNIKISETKKVFYSNPENLEVLSNRTKAFYSNNPQAKVESGKRIKAFFSNPDNAKKHSLKMKEVYSNPELRKSCKERSLSYYSILDNRIKQRLYSLDKLKQLLKDFSLELVNESLEVNTGSLERLRCLVCGHEFDKYIRLVLFSGREGYCPVCNRGVSSYESSLAKWLDSLGFKVDLNRRDLISPFEIDIYLPDYKIGIEVNGLYYHSEVSGKKHKLYHKLKMDMAEKVGIRLLQFWDFEINDKRGLVESMVLSKLGKLKVDYARKGEIREVSKDKVSLFYGENHLQGWVNSSVNFGLYMGERLVSVMSFSRYKDSWWNLTRFSSVKGLTVVGAFSKLFKYFRLKYCPDRVLSFGDLRWVDASNNVYLKNGFCFEKSLSPTYHYVSDNYRCVVHRFNFRRKSLLKMFGDKFETDKSEWENMKVNGFDRVWDCGLAKFVWNK